MVMSVSSSVATNGVTKRERLDYLIERGDLLANCQQERQLLVVCRPRTSLSRDTSPSSVCTTRCSSWTLEEDKKLEELVQQLGDKSWSTIALEFSIRDRKQCRERFVNHLAPSRTSVSSTWSSKDDEKLLQLQSQLKSRWSEIARAFHGKSAENVKNRCLLMARRAAEKRPRRRRPPERWTVAEKEKLRALVEKHGAKNWLFLASQLPGRTDLQCLQQWYRVLKNKGVKGRGTWTKMADQVLMEKVAEIGKKWTQIATFLPGRVGNQCRERFVNHLDPSINTAPWTEAEDALLTKAVKKHATQWSVIAKELPGRCSNSIKNHYYSRERRRMLTSAFSSVQSLK
ncbi:unnamed protein product [Peronospora farinosa]|uniref:Uncharacterized protein n=1 Tax=Peronospora farinosa TaxID=134698 RepID=A0AAV0UPU0_9STRA|nr:unnamed protein product [Peronospora farinosa]CAI5738860.1 unnamed protein product [Peronospora farinosa]